MDPDANALGTLHALVALSRVDWLYTDRYLHRAELLLSKFLSRVRYLRLREDQDGIPQLAKEIREATARAEWRKLRALAQRAAEARERVIANSQILPIAEAVYGPRLISADVTALALMGVVQQSIADVPRARDTVLEQLQLLARQDREWSSFYHARSEDIGVLQLLSSDKGGAMAGIAKTQKQILDAVEASDFATVKQLVDSITDERSSRPARLQAPRPAKSPVRDLAAPFSSAAIDRARELGLGMETLQPGLTGYLSCRWADPAIFPEKPLTETNRKPESCTCGHACPPDVGPLLRENLDFLMVHPLITSAGTRYLPWFGRETVLVETFAETKPDAHTGLLHALGLSQRRGLPRIRLEDALLTHGPKVCADLGLDPLECVVACIPFDAYLRLAPKHGWGQHEFWTHFDGYQVTRDLHLWALVGGNARFGGRDDLSSLTRDYDSERLTARFVILRRERFLVRETYET